MVGYFAAARVECKVEGQMGFCAYQVEIDREVEKEEMFRVMK